ncbi:MAG: hypothetical protein V7642_2254 [Burkholderiales bacterium]
MTTLLIGANGRSGRPIATRLAEAKIPFRAMIRDEQQQEHFSRLGADVVVADLTEDFSHALDGVDTVIFTAGSAETEGSESERLIDRDAIIKAVDYAKQRGIQRFIVISTLLAPAPERGPEALRHYVQMKRESDDYLINSGLDYVVLRPGPLTTEPETGRIAVTEDPSARKPVAREDVAAVVMEALQGGLSNRIIGFIGGDVPIREALKAV